MKVPATVILLLMTLSAQAEQTILYWEGCGISKKAFMGEMAAAFEQHSGVKIDLKGGGATKGIRRVSSGAIDIGGSCRDVIHNRNVSPIPEERWVYMNPVAWDALVVITHKENIIDNITLEQIRVLYKGKLTNWQQLHGPDAPIELYVREGNTSGVGQSIRELVFGNYNEEFVATYIAKSSGPLEQAIEANPNGIGITGVSSARRRDVKILKLEGIEPSYERIKDGGYLLYRPLYLVTPMDMQVKPEIKQFLNFVRGKEGKAIMRKLGTVPYEDAIPTWLGYLKRRQVAIGLDR